MLQHTSLLLACPFITQDGDSALTLAARGGHTDIVVQLVKAGANFDQQNKVQNYISHLFPHERLDFNIQGLYLT